MGVKDWKWIVKSTIYREAFWQLKAEYYSNKKTSHVTYKHFGTADYLLKPSPEVARLVFKAKTRMFDTKSNYKKKYRSVLTCPFCMVQDETFDHLFTCQHGIVIPNILQGVTFNSFSSIDLNFIGVLESFCKDISSIVKFLCRLLGTLKVIFLYTLNPTIFSFFLLYTVPQHILISSVVRRL